MTLFVILRRILYFAALASNLKSGVAFGATLHRDLVLFCAKLVFWALWMVQGATSGEEVDFPDSRAAGLRS
jgi:hypothetical protein